MFLRFGFILGQSGILGMLGTAPTPYSYLINLITTLSISAISSNGTVRGGGAYYLISRSLGPEFGGSIGLVFYLGFVFNTGMNAVGMIDCLMNNFGQVTGSSGHILRDGYWHRYLYATAVLVFCTAICAVGSQTSGRENWQDLFGILFPATAGIFAGASMSGDLRNPSKSIPKGTLHGLLLTFVAYTMVILSMGATIKRESLYKDLNIIQDINASKHLILMGELASSFFSALMGVIGSAKSLQALARDGVVPGVSIFGQGTKSHDEPTYAIILTFLLSQLTLFGDINQIANIVTMTYLMTFLVTNLACFLLKIGSAPNFRPSFRYFTWWTAAAGAVVSGATMLFVDKLYAGGCLAVLLSLFLVIHYTTPPKSWGDVSQSLIYHQVRKYLLRLKQEHVKFWRPQILLLVNDPRRSWKLIQFCNAMKKGALYILGHIVVTPDFQESFPEVKRQQAAWMKYIDFSKVKAFPQISIAPTIEWGARNIVLSAGLGGMRPNIAVVGFYNLDEHRESTPLINVPSATPISDKTSANRRLARQGLPNKHVSHIADNLPTDSMRSEKAVSATGYVNILEDLLLSLQINVAIAKGFEDLELPQKGKHHEKKYIDLWPIQMSAEIENDAPGAGSVLTTNFDTYTLILQLGCILNTVPAWKKTYKVRVAVFVEYESDVKEEQERVKKLLENLRIQAEVLVMWLSSGELRSYEVIVNGLAPEGDDDVEEILGKEEWWIELQKRRGQASSQDSPSHLADLAQLVSDAQWPSSSFQQANRLGSHATFGGLRKLIKKPRRRHSMFGLTRLGMPVSLNMRTHRLNPDALDHGSASELSSDEESSDTLLSDEESIVSAASENDADEYDDEVVSVPKTRRASVGDPFGLGMLSRRQTLRQTALKSSALKSSPGDLYRAPPPHNSPPASSSDGGCSRSVSASLSVRPEPPHRSSTPTFSCKAIPDTQVAAEEGAGPSIMFADSKPRKATSLPAQPHPLSFNDLPSRAQHLILNELIRKHSQDTAVVFTTLPSPQSGTFKSEKDSLEYLTGLEVLTVGLPPTLLVHSNSLTVTTAL
ncbi:amino acid permease-domain-containing protein [Tuber borchii]|uniref:Amino acid permease-domain-containing protein n=1 Tax=Tuber borchii TaxID=42251 RepID=A0A2T6ZAQ2_TUBBO|nr:amino acid permease-domain-containing protein [Tuber borchii]